MSTQLVYIGIFLCGTLLGFFGGLKLVSSWIRRNPEKVIHDMQGIIHDNFFNSHPELKDAIEVDLNTNDKQIFLYNKATSEFLAQGENPDSLMTNLFGRFPGKTFFLDDGGNIHVFSQNNDVVNKFN